jgi:uncharacterized damage-inducible protein DinB
MKAFYDGFAEQHGRIVETLLPLSPEQMQLRVAPSEWAIWQLASNMAGGRLYWLCFMLGEDPGVAEGLFEGEGWEDNPEHPRTADEVVGAFEKTWTVVEASLDRWTLADLTVEVTKKNFWGQLVTISPAWVLQRLMSHEMHHGSEISLILRVHGLPTLMNM